MFGDLMSKMQEAQAQMEVKKQQLDHLLLSAEVQNGQVKVTVTANRHVKEIDIAQSLIDEGDKEAIEDLVLLAINRALSQAEAANNAEMEKLSSSFLSGMGQF